MKICKDHSLCITQALTTADDLCHKKGLRFTNLRRKILHMIWSCHSPIKAYTLLDQLKTEVASPKPPTVYRTLDFLLAHGFIHKLNRFNAYVGCSHPLAHRTCYFLICRSCEAVQECCTPALDGVLLSMAKENHFDLEHITLEIAGLCENCR
jgi:Fur family zinc uptake transcriptional regulator